MLGLGRSQLADLAANGVRAWFLNDGAKRALLAEISAVAVGDRGPLAREGSVPAGA